MRLSWTIDGQAPAVDDDTSSMILYALASRQVQETVELFASREEAEAAVRAVVDDEPALAPDAFVAEIELPDPNPN